LRCPRGRASSCARRTPAPPRRLWPRSRCAEAAATRTCTATRTCARRLHSLPHLHTATARVRSPSPLPQPRALALDPDRRGGAATRYGTTASAAWR
jgi:hypothetical protein